MIKGALKPIYLYIYISIYLYIYISIGKAKLYSYLTQQSYGNKEKLGQSVYFESFIFQTNSNIQCVVDKNLQECNLCSFKLKVSDLEKTYLLIYF